MYRRTADVHIPKVNRKTGKLAGMIRSSGRTVNRGFTVSGVNENGEGGEATQTTGIATSRARVTREGAPFPTKELGDSGYAEGGSTLVERTTTMPERVKVGEFQNKKRRTKKKAVVNGKSVVIPPERGLLVTQPAERDMFAPTNTPTPPSKQFSSIFDSTGPAPAWDRPNVIPVNEPGVSTAEPITKGRPEITKRVIADPKAVKKNPKTKKTITKYDYKAGMVDQMLPGMENIGAAGKEPHDDGISVRQAHDVMNGFVHVEGPITAHQQAGEEAVPNPTSNILKRHAGKVIYPVTKETPIAAPQNTVSLQLAKIAGNTPVDQPVAAEPEGPAKTVRVYGSKKMVAPVAAPAKATSPKVETPKEEPEQLALPGMEPPAHSGGQQWLRVRNLSPQTRELQGRASKAGVPGGANPINVARGTEAPKSNRSFK